MKKQYYIQKGTDAAKDIWDTYGIYVTKTEGLNKMPDAKSPFSRNWPDEQGDDVYLPSTSFFESKSVTISFAIIKDDVTNVKLTMKNFLNYLLAGGDFSYYDTLKQEGFRGYYDASKISTEKYIETFNMIAFDLEFSAPNGICYGFDNLGKKSIFVTINSGYADFYYSDGTSNLAATGSFLKVIEDGFVIICPSILGSVDITSLDRKLLLTSSGKLLVTASDNLLIT